VDLPRTADLTDRAPVPDLDSLLGSIDEGSPLLRSLQARVEEAERLRRTAELEGYPDFDVGLGYRIRERFEEDPVNGDNFIGAGVKIRLPINRAKWRARVAERAALLRQAEARLRSARAQLRDTIRTRHADLRRAQDEVELLRAGLVPQTRQSLESNRAGYEVDKVDFLSLLDSQVNLLDAELALERAAAERRGAFSALEAAVGEVLR
jgi:outer membrane protein TolC